MQSWTTVNGALFPISPESWPLPGTLSSPSWTGTMKPISATCSSGAMRFTLVNAKETAQSRFLTRNGAYPKIAKPNDRHRATTGRIHLQTQTQPQTQTQTQTQTQQVVVMTMRRASRPDNHSDRFLPRWRRFVLTPHSGATSLTRRRSWTTTPPTAGRWAGIP